jgi:hypothetical protein
MILALYAALKTNAGANIVKYETVDWADGTPMICLLFMLEKDPPITLIILQQNNFKHME